MKNKPLLMWALGAGIIALVAFIAGYGFVWPTNNGSHKCGMKNDRQCDMMSQGMGDGMDGMMDENGGCGVMDNVGDGISGMMGGMGGAGGMMGPGVRSNTGGMMGAPVSEAATPKTIDQAVDAARRYVDTQGNSDLKVVEIREFTNDFYVRVDEKSTGAGAYELSVDRNTGSVTPAIGPNLSWNTKYKQGGNSGIMSGMMGGDGSGSMDHSMMNGQASSKTATTDMAIKKDQALDRSQKYLDKQLPGAKNGKLNIFYGYYTIEITKDGKTLGLLGVNGENGQVWYHSWYGAFLDGKVL